MKLPEKYKGTTPGPWKAFPAGVAELGGSGVAALWREGDERKANAILIADAPMLACLVEELSNELARLAKNCVANGYAIDGIPVRAAMRAVKEARQALAPGGAPESQEARADESAAR